MTYKKKFKIFILFEKSLYKIWFIISQYKNWIYIILNFYEMIEKKVFSIMLMLMFFEVLFLFDDARKFLEKSRPEIIFYTFRRV